MTRAGFYYGTPLRGYLGIIQGDPLPPTIFNMLFDAGFFHWATLVVGGDAGTDGFGRAVQWLSELFYSNGGLLTSPRLAWIQVALYFLTGLFNRVLLHINLNKMVGMVCQP